MDVIFLRYPDVFAEGTWAETKSAPVESKSLSIGCYHNIPAALVP